MSTDPRARAWVDISIWAFQQNFLTIRSAVGDDVGVIPMVKANAYGLGMKGAVEALEPLGPWGYGVATVEEGLALREMEITKPILVASPTPPVSYGPAVEAGLSVTVSEIDALRRLKDAAVEKDLPGLFHLEVDTGMGRAGLPWDQVDNWMGEFHLLLEEPLQWAGAYTHFHSADSSQGESMAIQWERLKGTVEKLPPLPTGAIFHACNSPGALRRPDFGADAVRPGIFLYGGVAGEGIPAPEPVAALRARVTLLKDVEDGATVGYGATHVASGSRRWATVGIGYGDGLPRLLSNRGHGLVRGERAPIIGRISMDVTMVDVTDVPGVEIGDVVTFFGTDGDRDIPLEDVAELAGTINYEILTDLTPRLPRTWTADGGY